MARPISIAKMLLVMLALSCVALGCNALPGKDPIHDSERTAWTFGAVSGGILLLTVLGYFLREKRGLWAVILSAVLFITHPAWTVSAWFGDCGMAKVNGSQWFTAILGVLATYQIIRWIAGRSSTADLP